MKPASRVLCTVMIGGIGLVTVGCQQPDLSEPFRQASIQAFSRPVEDDSNLLHGQDSWVFERGELAYTRAGKFWDVDAARANRQAPPERADPTPAILHFQRELAAHDIELIFVPLPPRQEIYPEGILEAELMATLKRVPRINPLLDEFLGSLSRQGVQVFDVTPLLLKHRDDTQGPLFLHSDPHLAPYAIELVVDALADRFTQRSWYDSTPKCVLVEHRSSIDYAGPTWRRYKQSTGEDLGTEAVALRSIARVTDRGEETLEMRQPTSPVLVLGDSQTRWWHNRRSSFFEQLSYKLGFPVDLIMTSGGGANDARIELARMAREDSASLDRIRTVVWYFSAIALVNETDGWLNIPLPPPTAPQSPQAVRLGTTF